MAVEPYMEEDPQAPLPQKRLRWATQRVKSGGRKRQSIMDRFHKGHHESEKKKRDSGTSAGAESVGTSELGAIAETQEGEGSEGSTNDDADEPRKIYFNQPLPPDALDEDGHPAVQFKRNKIRTAKYTPLSFVPKNLWYQFHNIANVYFLFLIILAVSHCQRRENELRFADLCLNYRSSVSLAHPIQDSTPCH